MFFRIKQGLIQIVSIFNKMLQASVFLVFFIQFESFEIEIDTNEAFYFELKSSTLDFQINDIDNF
ncbi:hypothetical protein AAFH68_08010 [Flavobacterium sp. CGRL1]